MNFRALCLLLFTLCAAVTAAYGEEAPPSKTQVPLTRAGLGSLEHACKLVAAINNLDWKTAEAAEATVPQDPNGPRRGTTLFILKANAEQQKDWHGIGAYRVSEYQQEGRRLVHKFAYGLDRMTPHEVWFKYRLNGAGFSFEGIEILGW